MNFQPGFGKMPFMLIVIMASLLFLVQCNESNGEDFGFEEEIKEHFGDMDYGKTIFVNNASSRTKADIDFQKGNGIFEDGDGREQNYKWTYLIDNNGDLLTGYLGTSQMTSTTFVALTRDETRRAISGCAKKDNVAERFACFDRVVERMVDDCQSSLNGEEGGDCPIHCFYDPGQCKGS